MPKIIENIREKLLVEAKAQLFDKGYSALTVRSVARACGVGVGTLYNYFPSKEMLVATFMLEDWQICIRNTEERISVLSSLSDVFLCVYEGIGEFTEKYTELFSDTAANKDRGGEVEYHRLLRSQISELLRPVCMANVSAPSEFFIDFISEALVTWTVEGHPFDEINSMLCKLFN